MFNYSNWNIALLVQNRYKPKYFNHMKILFFKNVMFFHSGLHITIIFCETIIEVSIEKRTLFLSNLGIIGDTYLFSSIHLFLMCLKNGSNISNVTFSENISNSKQVWYRNVKSLNFDNNSILDCSVERKPQPYQNSQKYVGHISSSLV